MKKKDTGSRFMLDEYIRKRKFTKTPEPQPEHKTNTGNRLIFVIHKHDASHLHYDLRLEKDGVLKSWAVPKGPPEDKEDKRLAIRTEDHPFEYKDFEGVIPQGNYGAGTVEIWDQGFYEQEKFNEREVAFILHGNKLAGKFFLVKTGGEKGNQWLFIKAEEKSAMPRRVRPMLATPVDEPFDGNDWVFEIKWDGYRAISEVSKYGINIYSRNLLSFNEVFNELIEALAKIKREVVLDGEIVVLDQKGASKFELLQTYQKTKKGNLVYYIFDILFLDGQNLTGRPLLERKKILRELMSSGNFPYLKISDYIKKDGIKFFKLVSEQGLEGIIAKKKESLYRAGQRTKDWLKIKAKIFKEAVIGGFTEPKRGRKYFGSLILGVFEDGKLKYTGHSGGGFNEERLEEIYSKLKTIETGECPFETPPPNGPVHWVMPKLKCAVAFSEWTKAGIMRQPVFLGLGEEINKKTQGLRFTNPDKVYFPEDHFTKGDVINYYRKISAIIAPYLKDRPQSLHRFPEGIKKESFYQKDINVAVSGIKTLRIYSESEDKMTNYIIGGDEKTLLYIINLGCIELNTWLSGIQNPDKPDFMVLDLDPAEIGFSQVLKTAKVIKKILDVLEVNSYIKTSGKSGMHIFIPLGAEYDYAQSRQFAEVIAKAANRELPDITSVDRAPQKRNNKIYIDYLQNRKGQTITAPYSLRPVKGLRVSAPLKWEELDREINPSDFNARNIFKRLQKHGDFFKPVLTQKTDLLKALNKLSKII